MMPDRKFPVYIYIYNYPYVSLHIIFYIGHQHNPVPRKRVNLYQHATCLGIRVLWGLYAVIA